MVQGALLLHDVIKTANLDNVWGGNTRVGIKHWPSSLEQRTRRVQVSFPVTLGAGSR
jgi:hypothetical protein